METSEASRTLNENDFFGNSDNSTDIPNFVSDTSSDTGGTGLSQDPVNVSNTDPATNGTSQEIQKAGPPQKSALSVALNTTVREAVKLYETITSHDLISQNQRDLVRELINKQAVALDSKLAGVKPADGEDFDSLSKVLRKANNKLDTLLEGKEAMFKTAQAACDAAILNINAMKADLTKLENES